jgi:hypothetical protein
MDDAHAADAAHGHEAAAGNPEVGHEHSDVNARGVLMFAAALLAVGIVIHLLIWLLFVAFDARQARGQTLQYPLAVDQEQRQPPEPRLQTNPRQDLLDMRAAEEQTLTHYGWVDRNAGVVRIPIDQAMKLTVERGLPARPPAERK